MTLANSAHGYRQPRQYTIGYPIPLSEFGLERSPCFQSRKRSLFLEGRIIYEELRLQNVHPVEFRKQIGRCIRNRAHRIFRIGPFPGGEGLVRSVEIEVVHLPITGIQACGISRFRSHRGTRQIALR